MKVKEGRHFNLQQYAKATESGMDKRRSASGMDVDRITAKELLNLVLSMPVKGIWKVAGAIFALGATLFGLGFTASSYLSSYEISGLRAELHGKDSELKGANAKLDSKDVIVAAKEFEVGRATATNAEVEAKVSRYEKTIKEFREHIDLLEFFHLYAVLGSGDLYVNNNKNTISSDEDRQATFAMNELLHKLIAANQVQLKEEDNRRWATFYSFDRREEGLPLFMGGTWRLPRDVRAE